MNLSKEIEVMRIGTLCGIYTKEELIWYLDRIISEAEDVPFEAIEASLCSSKNINDISIKLKEYTSKYYVDENIIQNELIHIIAHKYYTEKISLDDCMYYLYNLLIEVNLSQEVEQKIQYLSDGLFLAEQDIYGDIEIIKKDFQEFIKKY